MVVEVDDDVVVEDVVGLVVDVEVVGVDVDVDVDVVLGMLVVLVVGAVVLVVAAIVDVAAVVVVVGSGVAGLPLQPPTAVANKQIKNARIGEKFSLIGSAHVGTPVPIIESSK